MADNRNYRSDKKSEYLTEREVFNKAVVALIPGIRAHDPEARNRFCKLALTMAAQYRPMVKRICGENICEEVELGAVVSMLLAIEDRGVEIENPYGYLFSTLRRTALSARVKEGKHFAAHPDSDDRLDPDGKTAGFRNIADDRFIRPDEYVMLCEDMGIQSNGNRIDPKPDGIFNEKERELVQRAIDDIHKKHPKIDSDVILDRYYMHPKVTGSLITEMSESLEVPEGTMKRRLNVARNRLHETLKKMDPDEYANGLEAKLHTIERQYVSSRGIPKGGKLDR